MAGPGPRISIALAAPLACSLALAQPSPDNPQPTLRPGNPLRAVELKPRLVDQGFDDIGALQNSLWNSHAHVDLRQNTAWEKVFEISGPDGRRRRMRFDGALGASFPISEYMPTEEYGEVPISPAGLRFHIGPHEPIVAPAGPRSPLMVGGRIDPRSDAPHHPELTPHTEREAQPQTVADEAYRRRRVSELMRLAALHESRAGVR